MFLGTDFIELDVVLNKDMECNSYEYHSDCGP